MAPVVLPDAGLDIRGNRPRRVDTIGKLRRSFRQEPKRHRGNSLLAGILNPYEQVSLRRGLRPRELSQVVVERSMALDQLDNYRGRCRARLRRLAHDDHAAAGLRFAESVDQARS